MESSKPPAARDKTPSRILVLRYSSLGDVALTNPVLDGLQAAFPRAHIHFATKTAFAPAIQNHPALAGVVPLTGGGVLRLWDHIQRIRALKPDLVLDLHDSLRSQLVAFFLRGARVLVYQKDIVARRMIVRKIGNPTTPHTIVKYLKVLEPLGVKPRIQFPFVVHESKKDRQFLRDFLEKRRIPPSQLVVGLGPGAKWATKRWFPERWTELATRLLEDYRCHLLWFGSKEEIPLLKSIMSQVKGTPMEQGICVPQEHNLEQAIALLGRCELFVGNDSGLTHLASGRGSRVVVLYGSTTPALGFEPWGPHSTVEVSGLPCRPCDVHGKNSCPLGHFKCMKDLTVDLAEGAVKRSMRRSR